MGDACMRESVGESPCLIAVIVVSFGTALVMSGVAEDEPDDKPIEEIVVTAKRITCPDGWTCSRGNPIGGDTSWLAPIKSV